MSCSGWIRLLALVFASHQAALANPLDWEVRLTATFSERWRAIQSELDSISRQLHTLPDLPIDDQGGTGGFANIYPLASPPTGSSYAVEIVWDQPAEINAVALIPARRYNAKGLDSQYGLPDAFTVELLDDDGNTIRGIARESHTRRHPVRKGHPFLYQVSPPVTAAGMRILAGKLNPDYEEEGVYVQAWAEAMAFEGTRNVALGAKVNSFNGQAQPAPWHWRPSFLVDGQTPLGLPEIPANAHSNIGWISEGRSRADQGCQLSIDLEKIQLVDAIRLIPAKKPTPDLPSGFGFPRKLFIYGSETSQNGDWHLLATHNGSNPGHSPVIIHFPSTRARYFKLEAAELWKAFDDYDAFFALSEIEILSGTENLAIGKNAYSPDGMMNLMASGGKIWNTASLTDGFGPEGQLVPPSQWLAQLDRRTQLETTRHELRSEARRIVDRFRSSARIGSAALGLVGLFLIIAMPIRYRLHASRELTHVRERIAGDLHDEVGSNLGSIQMFADLAEGRSGSSEELKRIQRIAAETVSAVRDIVWLLRPTGDHRIGTIEHLRETSSIMLESLKWKFNANEPAWQFELPEESNRDLFLFFREALHNIIRHSKATEAAIRAEKSDHIFLLEISDNGGGIEPEKLNRPATLRALHQRADALRAKLTVHSQSGIGTRLTLEIPLATQTRKRWLSRILNP
jgi:signal transduction histidine kinase